MPTGTVEAIEHSARKANEWVEDLTRELDGADEALAWRVLRAYLQVLRDRLTIDEAAQLAAQLPHLLRVSSTRASIPAISDPAGPSARAWPSPAGDECPQSQRRRRKQDCHRPGGHHLVSPSHHHGARCRMVESCAGIERASSR
jgi:uncharacterized protein (DUF2267 family)